MKILDYILSLSLIALCCIFGYFVHQISHKFIVLHQEITLLHDRVENNSLSHDEASGSAELGKLSSSAQNISPEQSPVWAKLQKGLQNTVVQLFVTKSEKHILQPYKVPAHGFCTGSGFIISSEGEIVTNAHVVSGATMIMVQMPSFGKLQFEVDLIGIMPEKDFALLRFRPEDKELIESKLGKMPVLPMGNSDLVMRAQEVMALGYPLGQQSLKSTTGVISGRESGDIQMSAPLNPGSSGGPALNCCGEVIGINYAIVAGAQNVSYILPINDFKIFLKRLRAGGLVRKPYIGMHLIITTKELVKALGNPLPGGTYVVDVLQDSPLLGKIKPGDMLYDINGVAVDLYGEMSVPWSEDKVSTASYIAHMEVGSKISLTVYRRGKKLQFDCILEREKFAPIRHVFPEYEELPYEIFGGFVVMPLMLNHIPHLIQSSSSLAKFAEDKFQNEPKLIISYVFPDSPAYKARLMLTGAIIKNINDKPVHTLQDLQKALLSAGDIILIETTDGVMGAFTKEKICKAEPALALANGYQITSAMQALLKQQQANMNLGQLVPVVK